MHSSYESGILEDPKKKPDNEMFKKTLSPQESPDKETNICIEFEKGIPVNVLNLTDDVSVNGSLELFQYLNQLGENNGIGRIDIVENRFVGIKSRGVYGNTCWHNIIQGAP